MGRLCLTWKAALPAFNRKPPVGRHRLTRKVNGKTVTETFSSPASRAKARREVAEGQRFRELGGQLLDVLDVNEQICAPRPVDETASSAQEKKLRKSSRRKSPAK